jgi:hypothetical protein
MLRVMKKLIIIFIALALIIPSSALAIQKLKRTGEIEKDETGGYSETQKDYHKKRSKQIEEKSGAGYYEGGYHSKSPGFQQGEWQFVDSAGGGHKSAKAKKHKKEAVKKEGTKKKHTE